MKRIIVHIGLPKCASTALQSALSAYPHPEKIDYIGFDPQARTLPLHKHGEFATLLDKRLRFSCNTAEQDRQLIADYIDNSTSETIVISSENISLRFLPWDLPTEHKLAYLQKILPSQSEILMVYRNPVKLLIALYKEHVLLGYANSFEAFCQEHYDFGDISFFRDILLNDALSRVYSHFSPEKVKVMFLEFDFESELSKYLGAKLNVLSKNTSLSDTGTHFIQQKNIAINDFGAFFDAIEGHRAFYDIGRQDTFSCAQKRAVRKSMLGGLEHHLQTQTFTIVSQQIIDKLSSSLEGIDSTILSAEFKSKYQDDLHKLLV